MHFTAINEKVQRVEIHKLSGLESGKTVLTVKMF
jgi:hypothetical protein